MSNPLGFEFGMPDLRFVPVDALIPHEQHDDQRMQPLVERIREQGVLKNPPVVAPLDTTAAGERFVVLDGANRCMAARAAGFPHMVVQVVRYEEPFVRLTTWCHALGDYSPEDFEHTLAQVPGLECRREPLLHARAMLARREALACVVFADGHADTLHAAGDLHARNRLMNAVVDTYRHRKRFLRVTTDSLAETRERHPEVTALVVFPHFEPAEVVELATGGARVPAGITRHLIRWRALRLNLAVERLADLKQPLAAKNAWLAEWMRERFMTRQVRFYEEPTVLFDE
jgi:hypothetical protein